MASTDTAYRGYRICLASFSPASQFDWEFSHEDYDGAPTYSDDGPSDHRCGRAASLEACKSEIDALVEDAEAEAAEADDRRRDDPLERDFRRLGQ